MKAIIFDFDGVIADTGPAHRRSWARLAADEGIAFASADFAALLGRSRADSLKIFAKGRTLDVQESEDWLARKQRYFLDEIASIRPLPGVVALLDAARQADMPLGLASSSRNARPLLDRLCLTDYFTAIADGTTPVEPKPAPDIFLYVAALLAVPPAHCLVVEDAPAGLEAARRGGFAVLTVGDDVLSPTHVRTLEGLSLNDLPKLAQPARPRCRQSGHERSSIPAP